MADRYGDSAIESVLLVVAMEQEALPIIRELNLQEIIPSPFLVGLPAVAWKGNVGNLRVHLIWCGR